MNDPRKPRSYIPREELTAYERWELPTLDQSGNEVPREEERDVKPLTAGDIEEIRKAAREDGHAEGHQAGYQAGLVEGREQGHWQGFDQGLAEGREKGQEQGLADTRAEVSAKLERLEQLLGELLAPIRRHADEIETSLVNLATVLARAVVYRELATDSSHIRQVVRRAVETLPSTADNVRIRVHPGDAEWVREVAGRFEATTVVSEDDSILQGGCKVETRHSLVDFTVEKRFQKVVQGMLDDQLGTDEPGETEELGAMMGDLTDFHREVLDGEAEEPSPATEDPENNESSHPDHSQQGSDDDSQPG